MRHHVVIDLFEGFLLVLLKFFKHRVILLLRVLHVSLVLVGCFQLHHVLSDESLHLERVKVLLIIKHVSQRMLVILHFFKLDEEHVIQFVKVLLDVINGHASRKLEQDRVNAAIELPLHLSYLRIVLLVRLRILFHPELGVRDDLVHAHLKILMPGRLFDHF